MDKSSVPVQMRITKQAGGALSVEGREKEQVLVDGRLQLIDDVDVFRIGKHTD